MGIAIAILVVIVVAVLLFRFMPKSSEDSNEKEVEQNTLSTAVTNVVTKEHKNLMDDKELVAVITAAIYAASGSNGHVSKDTLIVRSIKRARR